MLPQSGRIGRGRNPRPFSRPPTVFAAEQPEPDEPHERGDPVCHMIAEDAHGHVRNKIPSVPATDLHRDQNHNQCVRNKRQKQRDNEAGVEQAQQAKTTSHITKPRGA